MKNDTRLYGQGAIDYKRRHPDAELNKFRDPIEEALDDIDVDYAEEVMREDPNLIYVDVI